MSWISTNYEKAALGGAVAVALGVAGVVVSQMGVFDTYAERPSFKANSETEVTNLESLGKVLDSVSRAHVLEEQVPRERPVDLFVGVNLFVKQGASEPVDLYLSKNNVHPPIPNRWWLEHDIDPGYADSPQRDHDGDGFSNLAEFEAKTNPAKASDHPELMTKLAASEVKFMWYNLKFSDYGQGRVNLRAEGKGWKESETLSVGDVAFAEGELKERFKLVDRKEIQEGGRNIDTLVLEDQSEHLKGVKFDLRRKPQLLKFDYTVELELKAAGQEGVKFELKEGERFALPYDQAATKKPYRLKSVKATRLPSANKKGLYQIEIEKLGEDGLEPVSLEVEGGVELR